MRQTKRRVDGSGWNEVAETGSESGGSPAGWRVLAHVLD